MVLKSNIWYVFCITLVILFSVKVFASEIDGPKFQIGDCIMAAGTDVWENTYMYKILKIGKYSYQTRTISKSGPEDLNYLDFTENGRYATVDCSEYKHLQSLDAFIRR